MPNGLFRWCLDRIMEFAQSRLNPAYAPAHRLRLLLLDQGFHHIQLLRLVPQQWGWNAATFESVHSLSKALDGAKLRSLADRLGVRREWLEGTSAEIYEPVWAYKDLKNFLPCLESQFLGHKFRRAVAFVDRRHYFETRIDASAFILLALHWDIYSDNALTFRRFLVCGDEWNWGHSSSRLELKVLARWLWCNHRVAIPIVPLHTKEWTRIQRRTQLLGRYTTCAVSHGLHLEDFALSESESRRCQDAQEIPHVVDYLRSILDDPIAA